MTKEEISQGINEAIIKVLEIEDLSKLTPEATFEQDLGADSLDTIEIIMELEMKFNLEIPEEDAEKISTIQEAIEYVDKKVNK